MDTRLSLNRTPTSKSTAQLALPGIDVPAAPARLDLFELIRSTFRKVVPQGEMPKIEISRRMTRTLGTFTPSKNLIRLSSRLLVLGTEDEQRHVAMHEVAHAVVHGRDPKARAHGREFKAACKELGLKPGRFVNIDHASWRSRMRYAVDCPACETRLLRKRRTRRVKCDCGASLKPQRWQAVGITQDGVRKL